MTLHQENQDVTTKEISKKKPPKERPQDKSGKISELSPFSGLGEKDGLDALVDTMEEMDEKDYSKETNHLVKRLFDEFNETHLLRYMELVQSPRKVFFLNFLAGIARGLGLTIGTAIVLMILFKITQHIIALNIPYITVWVSDWIAQITELLKATR